jgi:large subunit ribosomal protein L9
MKVYLLKDVQNVGLAGEIIKVTEGYALNFLIPRKLADKITPANEAFYENRKKEVINRQEVISSKTSMLAEKIKSVSLVLKRKMHDDGKLYGAVSASEIVDLMAAKGLTVAKNQIEFDKNIKEKGTFEFTVKLTSKLKPKVSIKIVSESTQIAE